jgi:hypothetical protein
VLLMSLRRFQAATRPAPGVPTRRRPSVDLAKWQNAIDMLRLVRAMKTALEEAGELTDASSIDIDNIYYTFLATLPKKVRDDVEEG